MSHSPLLALASCGWFVLALAAAGCGGSSSSPTAPGAIATTPAASGSSAPAGSTPVTPALVDMLAATFQDENHAQAVYQGVLNDFGAVTPFANVVRAEQNHAAAVARLFATRGLAAPVNAWTTASVPHFSSVAEACAAAAEAEIANIALYDRYLSTDLPTDVRTVFTNNRAASVDAHLPAFTRCR